MDKKVSLKIYDGHVSGVASGVASGIASEPVNYLSEKGLKFVK